MQIDRVIDIISERERDSFKFFSDVSRKARRQGSQDEPRTQIAEAPAQDRNSRPATTCH